MVSGTNTHHRLRHAPKGRHPLAVQRMCTTHAPCHGRPTDDRHSGRTTSLVAWCPSLRQTWVSGHSENNRIHTCVCIIRERKSNWARWTVDHWPPRTRRWTAQIRRRISRGDGLSGTQKCRRGRSDAAGRTLDETDSEKLPEYNGDGDGDGDGGGGGGDDSAGPVDYVRPSYVRRERPWETRTTANECNVRCAYWTNVMESVLSATKFENISRTRTPNKQWTHGHFEIIKKKKISL